MKIYFHPSMDSTGWPLLPEGSRAVTGKVWAGCNRMLGIMEIMLGLHTEILPVPVRTAALVSVMDSMLHDENRRFWTSSFEVDPYGVARSLLEMRDSLLMAGGQPERWHNETELPRLTDIAELSPHILPGMPDAILGIMATLDNYRGILPAIKCMLPLDQLHLLWQRLFQKLKEKGADIETDVMDNQPAQPSEIVMLQPHGWQEASENIAAWLRPRWKNGSSVIVISGDKVLDSALRRHGLPASGAGTGMPECSAAQILSLVISLGWSPPDPETVLEFLYCPLNPLPAFMRDRLIRAIARWPATGSPAWDSAVRDTLSGIENDSQREQYSKWLDILFSTENRGQDTYSMAELEKRIDFLSEWLTSCACRDSAAAMALVPCRLFSDMIERISLSQISMPMLEKLLAEAVQYTDCPALHAPQAGITFTGSPESIHGQADIIVWWNFTEDSVPSPRVLPLFQNERDALNSHGARLPDAVEIAKQQIGAWHRALNFASETLVLVCPDGMGGEAVACHPFRDEITSSSKLRGISRTLKLLDIEPEWTTSRPLPVPAPITQIHFNPDSFSDRERESFSSLSSLLSCPFRWFADYMLKIRQKDLAGILEPETAAGNLVHTILEEVLATDPLPGAKKAGEMAENLFRQKAPNLMAMLFQPGMEVQQENMTGWLRDATEYFVNILHAAKASGMEVEKEYRGKVCGLNLYGRPDLVISGPPAVIDIKLYSSRARREAMENNAALQLAIYAGLFFDDTGSWPDAGYFSIKTHELSITSADCFPGAAEVPGLEPESLLEIVKHSHDQVKDELKAGVVRTDVDDRENDDSDFVDEDNNIFQARRACQYCGWDAICGRRFMA